MHQRIVLMMLATRNDTAKDMLRGFGGHRLQDKLYRLRQGTPKRVLEHHGTMVNHAPPRPNRSKHQTKSKHTCSCLWGLGYTQAEQNGNPKPPEARE